jgi:hypothetical protein
MSNAEFAQWKRDQITYFTRYLENFKEGSEEYRIITSGIKELQKTL